MRQSQPAFVFFSYHLKLTKNKLSELTCRKIWLAPLAGFTDNPFRIICKENGADVLISEMVSADGIFHNKEQTLQYAKFTDFQRPFGIQLFGSDPHIISKAAERILNLQPDLIDINMGCPVKKVVKRGAGSALMKRTEIAEQIISELKKVVSGCDIPISAKIRSGWDFQSINAIEFTRRLEQSGLDIVCLHPRTKTQMFQGKSDWSLIKKLKENVSITVIGNGDIRSITDAEKMFDQTNCDSIMIGRGILGKPWLIKEIKAYLKTGKEILIPQEYKLKQIKKHLALMISEKGAEKAIVEMRSHFSYYSKGHIGGAKVRAFINQSVDETEIIEVIEKLFLNT
ncbi:MAG: tRNA dihydrouridine synthase DusB [Candidatus Cloacimonetes bacterium]|nr:tRNA dihydrouridine synthase DusB [Candidatus Cloacimonadota bacterium]